MNRLIVIMVLLVSASLVRAEHAESLLDSHLRQAESLKDKAADGGSNAAVAELKAEIDNSRRRWEEKLQHRTLGDEELLRGVKTETLNRARDVSATSAATESELRKDVALDFVIALAYTRNPDVKIAYQKLRATLRHYEQASYLEDLLIQYRAFVRELDTKVGPQTHKEMAASFFPSALALKGQMVDQEAEIAQLQYLMALRKAVNDAARGYFMIQYTARAIATVRESRDVSAEIERATRQQLEAGQATRSDALKAKSMLTTLDNQLKTLTHRLYHHIADVNAVLGLRPDAEWGMLTEADLRDDAMPLDKALPLAATQNQEAQRSRKDIELMETMVRMAETMVLPPGSAGMSQLSPSTGADAGPTRNSMANFPTTPSIDNKNAAFGPNAAYIDELRVRVREAKEMQGMTAAKIGFQTKDAEFQLDVARREVATNRSVSILSKDAFETQKQRYGAGNASFADYLESARTSLESIRMLEEARADFNKAIIDLQDALGRTAANSFQDTPSPKKIRLAPHTPEEHHD